MYNRMPVFNIFGVDPFDFGESNVANGFCQLANAVNKMLEEPKESAKYRTPNARVERDDKLDTFYVELPGVKKEDIDITITGEYSFTIVAKRTVGKTETTFRIELGSEKDIDHATLEYADGLLTVKVEPKKKEEPEVKKLQIQ